VSTVEHSGEMTSWGGPTALGEFDLEAYLRLERDRVDAALLRAVELWAGLLPENVAGTAAYGAAGEGKRLRPILCVTAYRACGGNMPQGDAIYDLGAALEVIHAYSLMHDDLPCMDDAELRRARPTAHRIHGEADTIIAGAVMIPLATLQAVEAARALGLEDAEAGEVAAELCRAAGAGGMVGGQVLDLLAEADPADADMLDDIHRLKTGALLTGALRMGARAARAPSDLLAALDGYGRAVGLAFQIADDLLDATATAEALGKNPSDAALHKSTYVSLYGAAEAERRARAEVDHALDALGTTHVAGGAEATAALRALARYAVDRDR